MNYEFVIFLAYQKEISHVKKGEFASNVLEIVKISHDAIDI